MYRQVTWCYEPLDAEKMHRAAQALVGDHDFSSFRAQGCQSRSPCRLVHFIDVHREGENVIMDIAANAFVHHMVRNIAGVLLAIGKSNRPVEWTEQLLAVREQAGGYHRASRWPVPRWRLLSRTVWTANTPAVPETAERRQAF